MTSFKDMTELEQAAETFIMSYKGWKNACKESCDFDAWKCEASRIQRDLALAQYERVWNDHIISIESQI